MIELGSNPDSKGEVFSLSVILLKEKMISDARIREIEKIAIK